MTDGAVINYDPTWALQKIGEHDKQTFDHLQSLRWPAEADHPTPTPNTPYGRLPLLCTESVEIILIRWRPGASSAIHDHGGGYGSVYVLEGRLSESSWSSPASLYNRDSPRCTQFSAGCEVVIAVADVHLVFEENSQKTISLHFYVDATAPMAIYDLSARKRLLVPPDHGAWMPQPHQIIEEHAW